MFNDGSLGYSVHHGGAAARETRHFQWLIVSAAGGYGHSGVYKLRVLPGLFVIRGRCARIFCKVFAYKGVPLPVLGRVNALAYVIYKQKQKA